jgi:L-lactate dehydrogenase complex protein LldG
MSSRDAILNRIRSALAHDPHRPVPPTPEVWPRENPPVDVMAERFQRELEAVHGEVIRCADMRQAQRELAALAAQESWESIGAMDRPLCREVCHEVAPNRVTWIGGADSASQAFDGSPAAMAKLAASVIEADYLLADTGTSMVACGRAEERLLCYLPPACVIVATADRLVEHLPAAWPQIAPRVADPQTRGEFVFITGPSRTADIEKILILGVHGPKRLIVCLVG